MRLRLKQLRMAVKDVPKWTGDDEKNVYNWLSSSTRIPADFLARFAIALPVDPTWLLTGAGDPEPHTPDEAVQRLRAVRVALQVPALTLNDLISLGREHDEGGQSPNEDDGRP